MKTIIFLALCFGLTFAMIGVDVKESWSLGTFQCVVQSGAQFIVVQGSTEYGLVNSYAIQNLETAKQFSLKTSIYLNTCRSKPALSQVQAFYNSVPSQLYDTIWIAVEKNTSPGCGWDTYTSESNCQYLRELVSAAENTGIKVGIYSSHIHRVFVMAKIKVIDIR